MFGLLKPKLPIDAEQQEWADHSFVLLGKLLGTRRLLDATVVLPTPEHFPDPYDPSAEALRRMVDRIASRMDVDAGQIDVELFSSGHDLSRTLVPFYSGKSTGAGGLYFHEPEERQTIAINEAELKDPDGAGRGGCS